MKLKERAKQLKSDIPVIFIALRDKETPLIAKIFAGITVAYALSPIDSIPDVIPVLGYLDDLILLPALVALICNLFRQRYWKEIVKKQKTCGLRVSRKSVLCDSDFDDMASGNF